MKSEYQGELFKEFTRKESSLKKLSQKMLPKRRPHILQVPIEQVISAAILVIVGLIVCFALGVEKGKREVISVLKNERIKAIETIETIRASQTEVVETEESVIVQPAVKEEKPYTIQLISYKGKRAAEEKAAKLKTEGIEAFLIYNDKWYQVCSGSYANKEEAEKDLKKLSKKHKGCFLRNK
ncbi:MAG: SPOR domain-containing protein [Candidatus Omnitrophica bacterium]|nr:SPOR domain-containing protein [Candidatus Omnitrophota bacterium]